MTEKNSEFMVTYRDFEISGKTTIFRLFGRDVNGKRVIKHVHGTEPYFYIPHNVPLIEDSRIKHSEISDVPSWDGSKVRKVTVQKPSDVSGWNESITYLKDMYEDTFEADIAFDDRICINYDVNGIIKTPSREFIGIDDIKTSDILDIPLRVFTFDIENIDSGTIEEGIEGKLKVCVITVHDSFSDVLYVFTEYDLNQQEMDKIKNIIHGHWKDNEYYPEFADTKITYILGKDEVEMFNNMFEFIQNNRPDIITGFNSNGYDIPVVCNRCKELNIDFTVLSEMRYVNPKKPHISGLVCMDIQKLYEEYYPSTVRFPSLDYISQTELGTNKLPRTSILEMYQTDKVALTAYNIIDVQLTVGVEKKNSLLKFFNEISIESFSELETINRSKYIDNLLLKESLGYMVLPTKKRVERRTKKYEGRNCI